MSICVMYSSDQVSVSFLSFCLSVKLFESIIAHHYMNVSSSDTYQFGFTLLGFVLAFLSIQQITTQLVVAMCSCALWISPKPSIR